MPTNHLRIFKATGLCAVVAVATCATVIVLAVSSSAGAFTILNDTFDAPNYSSFSFNNSTLSPMDGGNPNDVSFEAIGDSFATGGNPDAFKQFIHIHDISRDEFGEPDQDDGTFDPFATNVQSVFLNEDVIYDSSGAGALGTLNFSIDVRTTDPLQSVGFAIGNADNGSGNFEFTSVPLNNDGLWQTIVLENVDATSLNGPNLEFGFSLSTDADVSNGEVEFSFDVDNFIVIGTTAVPEPSSLVIAALGLMAFATRRR